MTTETIDHSTLSRLVEAGTVRDARVIGQPGGWAITVKYGKHEQPLASTNSRAVRQFRRLETLVAYLKGIGLSQFDVDATNYDQTSASATKRPDRSAALKRAHEAAAYDAWFRQQVQEALDEEGEGISGEVVEAKFAKKRAALEKRIAAAKT
ncbi:MAG: hypothetical protein LBV44_04120 [Methylobacillus sp.]|nr:hypothetical protein [Methylobacillus sp.]